MIAGCPRCAASFAAHLGFCWIEKIAQVSFAKPGTQILVVRSQPALHRIAMDIAKLLHKLRLVPNVEIVVALFARSAPPRQLAAASFTTTKEMADIYDVVGGVSASAKPRNPR
jgi:hypothetical protein